MEVSPQHCLIIAKQRFALSSADAHEIIKLLSRGLGNPSPEPK